ncbi:PEP-CTERM sorting domain-containing protein [Oscillatoria amoena NRMC-F 0135]|nr:PEP-CTERM sorting domain-containing protein [Oscillatoria laete-virens]MDL5049134.1 PEP-CTERM sorting domain-containing protein [Oscillatoria amoena NRMC-F 0135]MDL5052199.1 PEP-CTERM sorting domain-containing protein [Oscillatoria laete-virens NRMC-F 0139]
MKKHLITLLTAAGIFALALPSAKAAISTSTNSTGVGGYALDIRLNNSWTSGSIVGATGFRYGNNNFTSDGNLLAGDQNGSIWEINSSSGAVINNRTGMTAGEVYSFAQSGGYLFAANNGEFSRWSTNQNINVDSPTTITDDVRRSIHADPTGTKLFASGSGQDTVVRYTVDGSGNISEDWTTASIGGQVRGMAYVDGRGLYVANSGYNPDRLYFVNDSGTAAQVSGLPSMDTLFEAVAFANIDNVDYLFLGGALNGLNGLLVGRLDGNTTLDAWDFYAGNSTAWAANTTFMAGWATGGSDSGVVYWGSGSMIRAFNVTVIPEPSTYAMLALGLAMSAYGLRVSRKRKVASATTA